MQQPNPSRPAPLETKPKKRRSSKKLRNGGIVALLILLLTFLNGQFGIGDGLLKALTGGAPESSAHIERTVVLKISDMRIERDGEAVTLDALQSELKSSDRSTLYVLTDAEANQRLFSAVEALLKDNACRYSIE